MRSRYYDKQGNPITFERFIELDKGDEYRYIKQEVLHPSRKRVSTIWLGMDMGFNLSNSPDYIPDIFETLLEDPERNYTETYRWRTEEQAREMHDKLAQLFKDNKHFTI